LYSSSLILGKVIVVDSMPIVRVDLSEFKNLTGRCLVPGFYSQNNALGGWVNTQREQYKEKQEGNHSFITTSMPTLRN
jgi:hypothetical protein